MSTLGPTQTRVVLGVVAVAFVAIVWMLSHPRKPKLPSLRDPRILELRALSEGAPRPIAQGGTLHAGELLDFQIEVFDLCFAYVFKVESGTVSVAFGPDANNDPWDTGVYAPEWKDGAKGMHFLMPGDVHLYAFTSPLPLGGLTEWTQQDLDNPAAKCPRCGAARVDLKVEPPRPIPTGDSGAPSGSAD